MSFWSAFASTDRQTGIQTELQTISASLITADVQMITACFHGIDVFPPVITRRLRLCGWALMAVAGGVNGSRWLLFRYNRNSNNDVRRVVVNTTCANCLPVRSLDGHTHRLHADEYFSINSIREITTDRIFLKSITPSRRAHAGLLR